jgi:predicted amidohydrolase YtcJ
VKITALLNALCALLPAAAYAQHCPLADTIYYNGNILTGVGLHAIDDHSTPQRVQAIGITGDRIVLTGTNADVLQCSSAQTNKIDLHGAFAMPGFNDAHTHIADAGLQHLTANLDGVTSLAEMQSRIAAYAKTLDDPHAWILGGGWDHTKWPTKTLPTRLDLDAVTGDHPAFLDRVDGHIAVANTAALKAAGIDATTPDPFGGHIDRDASGQPTGIIRESPARALVEKHIPPPSDDTRRKALELSIQDALAHGVTSVQDFSTWDDWLILEGLERENKLPLRVYEWIDFNLPVGDLETRRASHDFNDPLLHLGMLKGFMDGSLGSRTAAMNAPYNDDPSNSGIPRYEQDHLNDMASERALAGFQLGFHAIGDRANDMALNAFEAAEQVGTPEDQLPHPSNGDGAITMTPASKWDRCPATERQGGTVVHVGQPCDPNYESRFRFRIEHAQVVSPGAFQRFHSLGVIASMQPSHLLTDMAWAEQRIGPERIKYAYAWRSFLTHGVPLAFGTDYPVESINPMRGLYSAITRMNEAGTQTFQPQEKLTLNEALYAYTQASAFAEWREKIKGQLAPGYLADLVVLDRDLTKSTPQQILHARVLRTVVGGITRYTAP